MPVSHSEMSEYYQSIFPVEAIASWLSYESPGYLARREWCFTLIGDIFTRYRSYLGNDEIRAALVKDAPEKIDIGAVYNVRANLRSSTTIVPVERELVFDIDMSDYDKIRTCCQGKTICGWCWGWMSCAAHILDYLLREDFGFEHILPVFSGRRGLHVWVSDKRARVLTDEERNSLALYMSVFEKDGSLSQQLMYDMMHDKLHFSLALVDDLFMKSAFDRIFLNEDSPNHVGKPQAAAVVGETLLKVLSKCRMQNKYSFPFSEGDTLNWADIRENMRKKLNPAQFEGILRALRFALLFPRLDIDVSTKRNHLLKLPFCIHPGTRKLCVPVEMDQVDQFDPVNDPPVLDDLLLTHREIPARWMEPLQRLLGTLQRTGNTERSAVKGEGELKVEGDANQ